MTFAGADSTRPPLEVVAREFVAVKSYRAKGKRLTTYPIDRTLRLEPLEDSTLDDDNSEDDSETTAETTEENAEGYVERSDDEIRDELTGQQRLFE